ncbi:hypothetical protein C8A05DRAFT_44083 [Staphylotrichum tortipilum]|uniref:C2H2-type domain-containing protein n=1 Tax=Staphylotrichum tortipilum TaxID=2831512 RepID=A0AAN6MKD2_9PEZI|nr:hypothetical protein C8A05DRAFT_44083 [Staphylotrichum longicolle]
MDPRPPTQGMDGPRSANGSNPTPYNAATPGRIVTQGFAPRAPTARPAPTTMVKDALTETPQAEDGPPEFVTGIRESWMSSASTAASRDSAVPSLFDVRASTISASTRYSARQSSIESPIWATSPINEEHCKDDCPQPSRYWCTFCDATFDDKTEWKLHEFKSHDRGEQGDAAREPVGTNNDAGLATVPSGSLRYSSLRTAWGCGFCAAGMLARPDYLNHVGKHYDDGKDKSDWQHTHVIEGLLRQPKISPVWMALVSKEESARHSKLRFVWNSETTGRATDAGEPSRLQDLLEFFASGGKTADEVVAAAYRSADARPEGNVSDLIRRHFLRNPEPHLVRPAQDPVQPPPDLRRFAAMELDDVISPLSPLPAPIPPPGNLTQAPLALDPAQVPHALHSFSAREARGRAAKLGMGNASSDKDTPPQGSVSAAPPSDPLSKHHAHDWIQHPLKQANLRRVDSSRSIMLSNQPEIVNRPGPQDASVASQLSFRSATPQPQLQGAPAQTVDDARISSLALKLEATASIRPHASSSTLSTHTGDGSHGLADSTSETMSDDSVSEPDSWLEVDGLPGGTRAWKNAFQQRVNRSMAQLWARYNRDWDALVVNQRPGGSSQPSSQSQEPFGYVQQGTSSHQAANHGLGLTWGSFVPLEDEDEDDDDDNYLRPPSLPKLSPTIPKRFACPYRKHDPHTYNMQDHEVCTVRSWSTISRLKEHLYRRHYKVHCQRCKKIFRNERELDDHEMSIIGCQVLSRHSPCDMTTYQHKQLRMKKHTARRQTDEDKWNDIYRLLFPHEQVPSPYPEAADDMTHVSSESQASFDFQHFLLSEMPGLFTQTAEQHAGRRLQARDGLAMDAIPRIIDEALRKAFTAWEARGSKVPVAGWNSSPRGPSSSSVQSNPTPQPPAIPTSEGIEYPSNNIGISVPDNCGPPPDESGIPIEFDPFIPPHDDPAWQAFVDMVGRPVESDFEMGGYQFAGY